MENPHPVATRRALAVYCVVAVVGGGAVAGALWGLWTGVAVACLAFLGSGGAAWLTWPRRKHDGPQNDD